MEQQGQAAGLQAASLEIRKTLTESRAGTRNQVLPADHPSASWESGCSAQLSLAFTWVSQISAAAFAGAGPCPPISALCWHAPGCNSGAAAQAAAVNTESCLWDMGFS